MSLFRKPGLGKDQKQVETKASCESPLERESFHCCVKWVMQHSKQGQEFKQWYDQLVAADDSVYFTQSKTKAIFIFMNRCSSLNALEQISTVKEAFPGEDSLVTPGFSVNTSIFVENELQPMAREISPDLQWPDSERREPEDKGFEVRMAGYHRPKGERECLFRVISFEDLNKFIGITRQTDYYSNVQNRPGRVMAVQEALPYLPPSLIRIILILEVGPAIQEEITQKIAKYLDSKFHGGRCTLTVEDFYQMELVKNPDLKNYVTDQKAIEESHANAPKRS